ncbi:hypothetical protein [Butyrivibrio sp. AE2032]|uniref:hypothetical protein n=1 Tax=Butyrivibrio sp. AE2032 TaxID=1458463 RepID=UPI0005516BE3|nr:hypothetical protein [Butyrivibrio sp. AE2032]
MKGKNNKNKDDNKQARTPVVSGEFTNIEVTASPEGQPTDDFMETPVEEPKKGVTLNDLADIDPELLTGKPVENSVIPDLPPLPDGKDGKAEEPAVKAHDIPTELNLDKNEEALDTGKKRRNAGIFFVVFGIILVFVIAAVTFALDTGMDESFISPLSINGRDVSSGEFSFMYHYELLSEGVDLFAADTDKMLLSPYLDDDNFATYRDYFRFVTAQDLQKTEILYVDATSQGYEIEKAHYDRANAYINWLKGKADELGVPLDTYIKGVFGSQVDEQIIINTLARKYFTEDYAEGEKLIQLSATDEQAENAYRQSRNIYDLVSYKLFRFTYEQREQAFIDTANLHAQQIIDAMGKDPSKFESCAAKYFSGVAANTLAQPDSMLVSDCRYEDISHAEFREWLFDESRTVGDAVIFHDEDGFPIILVFVSRDRMAEKLRNCYIVTVNNQMTEEMTPDMAGTQALSQEIFDYIDDADSCNEVENLYNDYILAGQLSVVHDDQIFQAEYSEALAEWIFAAERKLGDKTLIEDNGTFYVIYFISESPNPEWYDRVNSFLRMNNYQQFITAKQAEFTWSFNEDGLSQIKDVP